MTSPTVIRGFKDILPQDVPFWRRIEETARDLAGRFGFLEIRPPVLERTLLFARGIGESTDIVEKEMYTMEDRNGEKITLRPEATAGVTRAVIEHNLLESGKAVRLFSIGPMFRYERPQKGRQRQFHQLDVEAYGDAGPHIDAEVISLLLSFFRALGLKDLVLALNSLGCEACRPLFRKELFGYLSTRREDLCGDCQRRLETNPLRILDCKNPSCAEIVKKAPSIPDFLCEECRTHFGGLKEALELLGIDYKLDPFLVRGLDYYARTAFEVLSGDLGAQNALAGGGRYDGLVKTLGGPDVPGIGFAVGLERLALLLSQNPSLPDGPDYYLAILCPEALPRAFKLAGELRDIGLSVAADWEAGSLKSRMKRADKLRASKILMLGKDEMESSELTIRDLKTGEQTKASFHSLPEALL
jgi:histidyl-tRNA synthetase